MSNVYKNLNFLLKNTVTGIAAPIQQTDAIRYVDLTTAQTTLTQAIAAGDTAEIQARQSAITALTTAYQAADTTLSSQLTTAYKAADTTLSSQLTTAYKAADTTLNNQLTTQLLAIAAGFAVKYPVYAIASSAIALTGLAIDTPAFTGTVPTGSRILTIAQGGSPTIAHINNRIWIAQAGTWTAATDFDDVTSVLRCVLLVVENGLNSMDLIEKVYDKTNGQTIDTNFARVVTDANTCKVTFTNNISVPTDQFRLLLHKII